MLPISTCMVLWAAVICASDGACPSPFSMVVDGQKMHGEGEVSLIHFSQHHGLLKLRKGAFVKTRTRELGFCYFHCGQLQFALFDDVGSMLMFKGGRGKSG